LVEDVARFLAAGDIEPLTADEVLIVPDLQVWSSTFASNPELSKGLMVALQRRAKISLPTMAYIEDCRSIPLCQALFATAYRELNITDLIVPAHSFPAKPTRTLSEVVSGWKELRREAE
jgi:hypothetical protein